MIITEIIETKDIKDILEKKGIYNQYIKSKNNILSLNVGKTFFKERKTKGSGIWYFRINKKYRALGFISGNTLKVYKIDNHQN